MPSTDKASFKQEHFNKYSAEYELIDDVWSLLAEQEKLRQYLPARNNESPESYQLRLQTTVLPSTFKDTIESGAGRLGKAKVSEESLPPIEALELNTNGRGKTLDLFVFEVFVEILKKGCCVILVDTTDESSPAFLQLIPVDSIQNIAMEDDKLTRLVITEKKYVADGYGVKEEKRYKEYLPDELKVWHDFEGEFKLAVDPIPLTNAAQEPRGEVYALWIGTIGSKPWMPTSPPLLQLAKLCIQQMHKVSNLDRAEDIQALPPVLRLLPETADPNDKYDDIIWDPESVEEVPFGGDIRPAATISSDLSRFHVRNLDRQALMDNFVNAHLQERVRTDYQASKADEAETSRLELYIKVIQQGFKDAFRFVMLLSDRTYDPADNPGEIILSATAYNKVTDEEIKLLSDTFNAGFMQLEMAQQISKQQWESRGYEIDESLLVNTPFSNNQNLVIE